MSLEKIRNHVLYLTVFLTPIAFVPFLPNALVSTKIFVLTLGVSLATILTALSILRKGSLNIRLTIFNLSVFLFALASLIASYLRTPNKLDAFYSPGTATAIVACAVLFYLISLSDDKNKSDKVKTALIFSAVVVSVVSLFSFLGLLSVVSSLPAGIGESYFSLANGVLPTIVFLLATLALTITGALTDKEVLRKSLHTLASVVIVVSLLAGVYFYLSNKNNPSASMQLPSYSVGWNVLVDTLKVSPLMGSGHGNYITAFNRFRPISYSGTDLWNLRFNTSRSFFMTYVTETGLLGLIAIGIMLYVSFRLIRAKALISVKGTKSQHLEIKLPGIEIVLALTILLMGLLFLPAGISLFVFLFSLLAISDDGKETIVPLRTVQYDAGNASKVPALIVSVALITTACFAVYKIGRVTTAEYYYQKALVQANANNVQPTFNNLSKAIRINPGSDRYYITLSRLNLAIARSIAQKEEVTDNDRQILLVTIRDAINSAKQSVALNRPRALNWEVLASTYRAIIPVAQGADQFAIQTYNQAIALDPLNTDFRIALGSIYMQIGDYQKAIEVFKLATLTKPNHSNAHFNLAAAYREAGNIEQAKAEVTLVLSLVEPNSQDFELAKAELERLQQSTGSEIEPTEGPQQGEQLNIAAPEEELDPKLDLPDDAAPPEADDEQDELLSASPSPLPSASPASSSLPSPTPQP